MFTTEQARAALDGEVYTTDGERIGKVGQIYLDDQTNEPEWVTVTTGLFGTRESFVPLSDAQLDGNRVVVPYDKAKIKDAPQIDADSGQISREEEGQLYSYYGKDYGDETSDSDTDSRDTDSRDGDSRDGDSRNSAAGDNERAGTSIDTDAVLSSDRDPDRDSGLASDRDPDRRSQGSLRQESSSTDDALRRAEESLNAGKASGQGGRVRLRKYIVIEEQTITVPVRREEVRVEQESDADTRADSDSRTDTDTRTEGDRESIDLRGERSTTERTI